MRCRALTSRTTKISITPAEPAMVPRLTSTGKSSPPARMPCIWTTSRPLHARIRAVPCAAVCRSSERRSDETRKPCGLRTGCPNMARARGLSSSTSPVASAKINASGEFSNSASARVFSDTRSMNCAHCSQSPESVWATSSDPASPKGPSTSITPSTSSPDAMGRPTPVRSPADSAAGVRPEAGCSVMSPMTMRSLRPQTAPGHPDASSQTSTPRAKGV